MFVTWLVYIMALIQAIGSHLFIPNGGGYPTEHAIP